MLDGVDFALQLRANSIDRRQRELANVTVDMKRIAGAIDMPALKFTWEPGLAFSISGKIANIAQDVTGGLAGTVSIATKNQLKLRERHPRRDRRSPDKPSRRSRHPVSAKFGF